MSAWLLEKSYTPQVCWRSLKWSRSFAKFLQERSGTSKQEKRQNKGLKSIVSSHAGALLSAVPHRRDAETQVVQQESNNRKSEGKKDKSFTEYKITYVEPKSELKS